MNYLAFDLGADSGRAIVGSLTDRGLDLTEVHRFPNVPVRARDTLHWDVLRLWHEIKAGLRAAHVQSPDLTSIGLDTWGCDFALLDATDRLLGNPVHYRDARTTGLLEPVLDIMSAEDIFAQTGIQFLPLNSLIQLIALQRSYPEDLERAAALLTIPDLFNFWLTGRKVNEFSNATTTQCLNPRTLDWADGLLAAFAIPRAIFQEIVHPGTQLDTLHESVIRELDVAPLPVIAPACHDTGSAVAAIPASNPDCIWISSGTWSIMGVVVPEAILGTEALTHNFTNEGGVGRTFRFCKNIMGLWLLQECRRTWERQGTTYTYPELSALSQQVTRTASVIDPDHELFLAPGDMPARIQAFCTQTGQPVPDTVPSILRCITDSLALKYRWVLERMEETLHRELHPIHVVGGGSRNDVLNQATADATGRAVIAGPAEATATGNIMVQAVASGQIDSFREIGDVVRQSSRLKTFEPSLQASDRAYWDDRYAALQALVAQPPALSAA